MRKEYEEISDRVFDICCKLERMSAMAFYLGITSAGEHDDPNPEIIGLTFENIGDQLKGMSDELSDISIALSHEVRKNDSTERA